MTSAVFQLIERAMRERKIVLATYDGHPREMCPHTLGHKHGREKALFYQFGGSSRSGALAPDGSPANWRCAFLDQLQDVSLLDGPWHTAIGGHSRPQTCVDDITLEVFG